jgi:heat shock protein HslJ
VFDGNSLDGRSFCNAYSGPYRIDGGVLVVEGLGGTEMGCDPAVMAAESVYLAALGAGGELTVADDELVLTGEDAVLRFRRVPPVPTSELVGTDWVLDTVVEGEVVSSVLSASTLRLDADGGFHAGTACHELVGSWTTSGAQLRLPDLVTQDRACPEELRAQDEHELAVLGGGPTVEITADRLTLTGPFGAGLSYRDDAG